MKNKKLLSVSSLTISIDGKTVVNDISFNINEGEVLCLVGESGSGKSLSASSVIGLLPDVADISAQHITFEGQDLLTMSEEQKRLLRGREISMIFQEPMTALNPVMTVGAQVAEVFEVHTNLKKTAIKKEVIKLFNQVKIPEAERRFYDYPFQMSGGQRQRVMIAMALAMKPKLLIADEPTTALDVTVQQEILQLIHDLKDEMGMAVLFITHDFGVVQEMADHVAVMKDGKLIEEGTVDEIMSRPRHAYTKKLLAAMPELTDKKKKEVTADIFLKVENVNKIFHVKEGGFFGKTKPFYALKNVSFDMKKGETIGVVGESGCGKSTLSRCLVRLYEMDSGQVTFKGQDTTHYSKNDLKIMRRDMQMVFQDPYSSLNPRMKVGDAIAEGLKAHKIMGKTERKSFVEQLLLDVGLDKNVYDRYPHQFSGGQRQRIGIARALALRPALIIADEAVSALDVSVQKQVLDLMADLKKKYQLSYLFVSHDLRIISQVSDRVLVMKDGEIVEQGYCHDVFSNPQHPYTKKLLRAIPSVRNIIRHGYK